ncbi:CCA tRNA nucleotidyltransferase [Candidatus Dependentiae bacterium]|nr:CCA tRNA nucleotidyltransferase [Candidatus Dependentiae bacterium]
MKTYFNLLEPLISPIKPILETLIAAGATPYLVGGCVRDMVIGRPLKDLDLELHGITLEKTQQVLTSFGHVSLVGKQFGVLRLAAYDIDWSLPRADSLGRKPTVAIDPHLGIMAACKRRDLTMNAMAIDLGIMLSTKEVIIIDHYGGLNDIYNQQLRAVDEELFIQDPLRFFRVMQFIGRFQMQPDKALNILCQRMSLNDPVSGNHLALERVSGEIKKLFTLSERPSLAFRWLAHINKLHDLFPELAILQDTPQRPDYHPEGSVFEHTMQAIDAAARFKKNKLVTDDQECMLIMLGVLCHDLGKTLTTTPDLKAHGHDEAGVPIAQALCKKLTNNQELIKAVEILVRHHLAPFILVASHSSPRAYKRLAARLGHTVTMRQLGLVALADRQGRNGQGHEPLSNNMDLFTAFLQQCDATAVTHGPEAPVLLGRHLVDIVAPGPKLGELLQKAYTYQIEKGVTDVDALRTYALKNYKSRR